MALKGLLSFEEDKLSKLLGKMGMAAIKLAFTRKDV